MSTPAPSLPTPREVPHPVATRADHALAVVHALAVSSGTFKATAAFAWLPVDPALLASAVVALALVRDVLVRRGSLLPWGLAAVLACLVPGALVPVTVGYRSGKLLALVLTVLLVVAALRTLRSSQVVTTWLVALTGFHLVTVVGALLSPDSGAWGRLTVEGSTTITAGRASGLVLLAALVVALSPVLHRRPLLRAGAVALAAAGGVVLVGAGSRGPFLTAVLTVVVVALLAPWPGRSRRTTLVALLAAAGVAVVATSSSAGARRLTGSLSSASEATSTRTPLWEAAWRHLHQYPDALVGTGWGGYARVLRPGEFLVGNTTRLYPHDVVLEAFVEGGVVAGLALTVAIVASVTAAVRRLRAPDASTVDVVLLALAVFLTGNALVSGDLNDNRLLWVVLALAWTPRQADLPESHDLAAAIEVPTRAR